MHPLLPFPVFDCLLREAGKKVFGALQPSKSSGCLEPVRLRLGVVVVTTAPPEHNDVAVCRPSVCTQPPPGALTASATEIKVQHLCVATGSRSWTCTRSGMCCRSQRCMCIMASKLPSQLLSEIFWLLPRLKLGEVRSSGWRLLAQSYVREDCSR